MLTLALKIATSDQYFAKNSPHSSKINITLYFVNDIHVETSSPAFTNSKYVRNLRSVSGMKWKKVENGETSVVSFFQKNDEKYPLT